MMVSSRADHFILHVREGERWKGWQAKAEEISIDSDQEP